MKFLIRLLPVMAFFLFSAFISIDDIVTAFKNGDSAQVAKYFDETVELALPEKTNSYSKSQAELILHDFFVKNGVKNFTVVHKGDNDHSQFCIGRLGTANGNFRTTFFLKLKNNQQLIQELRLERQ